MKIDDGTGTGSQAKVDSEHRVYSFSTTEFEDKHKNKQGLQWSLYFTATPTGPGNYFFYFKNTGTDVKSISDIRIMGAAPDTVNYHFVSGTPIGGITLAPVNRNTGFSTIPSGIIQSGASITGLTDEGVVFFERLDTANKRYKLNTTSSIILSPGGAIAFEAVAGASLITCVVSLTSIDIL